MACDSAGSVESHTLVEEDVEMSDWWQWEMDAHAGFLVLQLLSHRLELVLCKLPVLPLR